MTPRQKKAYLKNPNKCPYCKSDDLDAGNVDYGDMTIWQIVECKSCQKEWTDIYSLSDVEEEVT